MLSVTGSVGGSVDLRLAFATAVNPADFVPSMDAAGTGTDITYVACFAAGTRVWSVAGEAPVERLRVGDAVWTRDGTTAPVRWLGRRRMEPAPETAWPVRIAPGAFGDGLPTRGLLLSPDHAIYLNGALIPVRYLVNGASIRPVPVCAIEYWHVELDRHAVIFAEGLACESYLDTGSRSAFDVLADKFRALVQALISRRGRRRGAQPFLFLPLAQVGAQGGGFTLRPRAARRLQPGPP